MSQSSSSSSSLASDAAPAAEASPDNSDNMVSRGPSIDYNKALNNNDNDNDDSEPNPAVPSSAEDEGFVGEFMLNDDPDEKKRQRPVSFSKKLRRLSLGKNKIKPSEQNDGNDSDNDSVGLMSTGNSKSSGRSSRGRSSRRDQMREALESGSNSIRNIRSKSPSVLRRLRRRDSNDSCSTLMQRLGDDDDHDDDHEEADELAHSERVTRTTDHSERVTRTTDLGGDQPHQIVLTDTNLLTGDVEDDLSDDEDTVYSQFQPSLNLSLRAERSMFVKYNDSSDDDDGVIDPENNNGDPMVVVVTNNDFANSEASLDLSVRSEAAETESATDNVRKTASRSPKRQRGTLSRRQQHRANGMNGRLSVSPKRNKDSVAARPKRHSTSATTIPKRHSSVPKNALKSADAGTLLSPSEKRSSLTGTTSKQQREKSPKREKASKREKTLKREKSPKRVRDKKKERRKSTEELEVVEQQQ
ncbi:unnamed protein product [Cylindrotheca closterium]|uniref:Uncharacterized protein n=1 Tax=Cylindrotheca closterium TaxID=2856 RepID=A0AAD2JH49_9STRA|nr:unnamed protein product [Cylindrotheca closterium]